MATTIICMCFIYIELNECVLEYVVNDNIKGAHGELSLQIPYKERIQDMKCGLSAEFICYF